MAEKTERLVRREVRSPRSAAIAGILYSVITIATMILLWEVITAVPAEVTGEWLDTYSGNVSLAVGLVPFSGIAFLWFTGVIRDRLGDREDRFFSTLFFGSGIIFVVLTFMWAATLGAVFSSYAVADHLLLGSGVGMFGSAFINEIIGNFLLRMAGVYMISIGTLWTRTSAMPRWLTIATYVVALGFLVFSGNVREARFIFPGWVIVVSVYVLALNYRLTHHQEGEADLSPNE
jgi:hypothetical protein